MFPIGHGSTLQTQYRPIKETPMERCRIRWNIQKPFRTFYNPLGPKISFWTPQSSDPTLKNLMAT